MRAGDWLLLIFGVLVFAVGVLAGLPAKLFFPKVLWIELVAGGGLEPPT